LPTYSLPWLRVPDTRLMPESAGAGRVTPSTCRGRRDRAGRVDLAVKFTISPLGFHARARVDLRSIRRAGKLREGLADHGDLRCMDPSGEAVICSGSMWVSTSMVGRTVADRASSHRRCRGGVNENSPSISRSSEIESLP